MDVFKLVNLGEWRIAQKEGDVQEMYDKVIGRKIVKISGKIPAANFISIPRSKTSVKNLALTGRYVYAQMQVAPGNLLSIHLDYLVTSERSVG